MSTQVQYRRGSNVQVAAFTGALGEIVVDTTNKILVVNDGTTVGGFPQVGLTATQTITNKVYNGTSVSVTANVTGGNILTGGLISATGNITSAGNVSAAFLLGNASFVTGLSASKVFNGTTEANIGTANGNANITVAGTSNVAVFASTGLYVTGLISASGNVTSAGNISAGNISVTTASTAASYSATGNVTGGNLITGGTISVAGNIVSTGSNGVANIGSATTYFNTVHAKATSAQYADIAEVYVADDAYTPGTVLIFGGNKEVTISDQSHSIKIAGVVSTNPSFVMNSCQQGEHVVQVGLLGRVPCRVKGNIEKGDLLVASSTPGVAEKLQTYQPGCVVGKALNSWSSDEIGTIEVVVGRL